MKKNYVIINIRLMYSAGKELKPLDFGKIKYELKSNLIKNKSIKEIDYSSYYKLKLQSAEVLKCEETDEKEDD